MLCEIGGKTKMFPYNNKDVTYIGTIVFIVASFYQVFIYSTKQLLSIIFSFRRNERTFSILRQRKRELIMRQIFIYRRFYNSI